MSGTGDKKSGFVEALEELAGESAGLVVGGETQKGVMAATIGIGLAKGAEAAHPKPKGDKGEKPKDDHGHAPAKH